MTIDLSFTKDPAWIEARTRVWEPWAKELKTDLRKKKIEQLRHYFFTGECLPGAEIGDGAKVSYFPLMNAEGWNYVFQHLARNPSVLFHTEYYQSINGSFDMLGDFEASLRYFDYFHGSDVQEDVGLKSTYFPEGFEVNVEKKAHALCAKASIFIKDGLSDLIYHRRANLFSMLPKIEAEMLQEGSYMYITLSGILRQLVRHEPRTEYANPGWQKTFLNEIKQVIENLDESSPVRKRWLEVKKEVEGT